MMKFVFQPLVDLRRHALAGFEALARFRDGLTPQMHFDEARRAGTLVDLELRALAQILATSNAIPDGLLLTMNASGPTIDAFAKLNPALDPRLVWGLELHEQSAPELSGRARISADELGCLLLVDDAGIGFATRERIIMLNPHIVKLDRSLFTAYQSSPEARQHVDQLLAAARETGAKTLVEGIETASHLSLARELDFDFAQGFYFSPGVPPEQLPQAMAELGGRLGIDTAGF
ncbi:EAL domain-containing protein [Glutamicibacter arilaitensis]|uniref:EAL domain-containing protein n=1 Tax=Glutamicibacter arilaitensis TaxID=256701 RepID=UPI003A8FC786